MACVDKIEIDLTIEIAETALPLARLLELGRGAFVPLGPALRDNEDCPLQICANGKKIGEARVVLDGEAVNVVVASR